MYLIYIIGAYVPSILNTCILHNIKKILCYYINLIECLGKNVITLQHLNYEKSWIYSRFNKNDMSILSFGYLINKHNLT